MIGKERQLEQGELVSETTGRYGVINVGPVRGVILRRRSEGPYEGEQC